MSKIEGQDHSITWRISSKNAVRQQRIGWATSNLAWTYRDCAESGSLWVAMHSHLPRFQVFLHLGQLCHYPVCCLSGSRTTVFLPSLYCFSCICFIEQTKRLIDWCMIMYLRHCNDCIPLNSRITAATALINPVTWRYDTVDWVSSCSVAVIWCQAEKQNDV